MGLFSDGRALSARFACAGGSLPFSYFFVFSVIQDDSSVCSGGAAGTLLRGTAVPGSSPGCSGTSSPPQSPGECRDGGDSAGASEERLLQESLHRRSPG